MEKKGGITRKDFLAKSAKSVAGASLISSLWSKEAKAEQEDTTLQGLYGENSSFTGWAYKEMPLGSVKPKGWLLNQLEIMRKGTTGHLDETYNKIKDDNGWLGGRGDDWEETPYWLDGAVPLAYLLDDEKLKAKVQKYIDWVIDNQRDSGYFGPITDYERKTGKEISLENPEEGEDWWPKMVMLKVLKQYYSATEDSRVIPFMTNYFKYQLEALKNVPIGHWTEWAKSRGAENVMIAQWLYDKTGDDYLLELASFIEEQSYNWSDWFGDRDWVMWAAAYQGGEEWMRRHAVNVSMALKSPAVNYQRTGHEQYIKDLMTGFDDLMLLHGLPFGIFSGDEDLHGNDPAQGVELCAVVETMYSLEQILGITGNANYADALERIIFNVFPAQTTDDFNARQYFQVANQINIKRGVFNFSLPFDEDMNNVLGMRSGYTCCLANMHQGWPKYTNNLWVKNNSNGIAALIYAPNEVTAKLGKKNIEVTINEITDYPFGDSIVFKFSTPEAVSFPFQFRIPSWSGKAVVKINGKENQVDLESGIATIDRQWRNGDKVSVRFPMEVSVSTWGRNSKAVEYGPLVYALKLEEKWKKGSHPEEGDYWSVFPKGDWNYGLLKKATDNPGEHFQIKQLRKVNDEFVWNLDHAPSKITTRGKKIPAWKIIDDVAPVPVTGRTGVYKGKVDDSVENLTLVPVACTKVRVVSFPVVS